jgi:phytoene/squalene synthetase
VVPAPAPTVDALIAQLEELRKQKAELEARELALVGQLSGLLKDQSERLRKLGVVVLPGTPKKEAEQLRKVEPAAPSPPSGDLFRSDLPSPPRK